MKANEIITEKLTRVNQDVDMIFKKCFENAFRYIKTTGKVNTSLLNREIFESDELLSRDSKRAHRMLPVKILVNLYEGNSYDPKTMEMYLNIHQGAWASAEEYGSIEKATSMLRDMGDDANTNRFIREFEPATIKGSIHHELTHWIDDALHNQHIHNFVMKAKETGTSRQDNIGTHERQSQIHNIVQLRRKLKDKWDTLTFEEMIQHIPSMGNWAPKLDKDEYVQWRKDIFRRMAREDLLGAKMGRGT